MSDQPQDLLDYSSYYKPFTHLVTSFETGKVMSIEASFGRGKSFFRQGWARHMRDQGEVVIELDAQKTDHSGDPVVTFIGALLNELGDQPQNVVEKAKKAGLKYGKIGLKLVAGTALRVATGVAIDGLVDSVRGEDENDKIAVQSAEEIDKTLSGVAENLITSHLLAERARVDEMPAQIQKLREMLLEAKGRPESQNIIILIDELDRCHPDYALALLEAMKLVFNQPGFVFCLMVHGEYLERLASHRFGAQGEGEAYIDKFVDLRTQLPEAQAPKSEATRVLFEELQVGTPLAEHEEFSVARAAHLAGEIVAECGFSMREIKRVKLKVEIALRSYRDEPVDCALLVWLGFEEKQFPSGQSYSDKEKYAFSRFLPRSSLSEVGLRCMETDRSQEINEYLEKIRAEVREQEADRKRQGNYLPMIGFSEGRPNSEDRSYAQSLGEYVVRDYQKHWTLIRAVYVTRELHSDEEVAEIYLPSHRAMLNGIHLVPNTDT